MTMLRVALCFQNYGPYHRARLAACDAAVSEFGVLGMELAREQIEYGWQPVPLADVVSVLVNRKLEEVRPSEWFGLVSVCLDRIAPDVCAIAGYSHPGMLAILQWCWRKHRPAILMSDSRHEDEPRSKWKESIKRRLVQGFSVGFVAGTPHVDYLVRLGMPGGRIFTGYDAVDNRYFAAKTAAARGWSTEVRKQLELPENYFLASARFIEKKNLPRLFEAYALYRKLSEARSQKSDLCPPLSIPWSLVLLGDGELRPTLNSQLTTLNLHAHVHMPGFKQYDELPAYYGLAGAFIHASTTEQWGLVVNEAMSSGLPVLVSNRCGCAADLVQDGRNGFTFDPLDVEALAQLMLKLSTFNAPQLSTMGQASREIIAKWGPERFASGLKAAAEKALEVGFVKPTLLQRLILKALLTR